MEKHEYEDASEHHRRHSVPVGIAPTSQSPSEMNTYASTSYEMYSRQSEEPKPAPLSEGSTSRMSFSSILNRSSSKSPQGQAPCSGMASLLNRDEPSVSIAYRDNPVPDWKSRSLEEVAKEKERLAIKAKHEAERAVAIAAAAAEALEQATRARIAAEDAEREARDASEYLERHRAAEAAALSNNPNSISK